MGIPLLVFLGYLTSFATATILSDTGCSCALTKSGTTTPGAPASVAIGCSSRTDWNGTTSKWCLTDQTNGACGLQQPSFGWVDTCATAGFSTAVVIPPPAYLEWDQGLLTYYTGQTITINWTSVNILADDLIRITYPGGNTRTLTTGSGVNPTAGTYSVRLSDSSNSPATNVAATLATTSNPTTVFGTTNLFSVIQSRVSYINVWDGTRLIAAGNSMVCDNRNITVEWRGLGTAGTGLASLSIRSSFGGTTVGTALTNIPVSGNTSIVYLCPRTFTPSGLVTYSAQLSVQPPGAGANAYTLNSVSFSLSTAPTQTPTPSITPTPSKTPSPTPSITPSPSQTSSITASPTPSQTSTPSPSPSRTPSPSTTETARPSLDIAAIGRAAASAVDTTTPVVGAVVGTIAAVALVLLGYMVYQRKQLTRKRLSRLKATHDHAMSRNSLYGIESDFDEKGSSAPSVVMYTVNMPGRPSNLTSSSKKAFPPQTSQASTNRA